MFCRPYSACLNQGGHLDAPYAPEAYFRRRRQTPRWTCCEKISHGEIQLEEPFCHFWENVALLKYGSACSCGLDPADALIFLLRYVEGMSNGELAEVFGQEKNNIAVRCIAFRQTLQVEMGQ